MLVGLGNPGLQYEATRHNAGFMAMDKLAEKYSIRLDRLKYKAYIGDGIIEGRRVLLMKPQTYMNNSGEAVSEVARFYKIPPENILVMFDDISLPVGAIRIRRKGSAGGHNGIKDIIALIGSDNFPRIKIGVGGKPHPDFDLKDFVLSKFYKEDTAALDKALDNTVKAVGETIKNGIDSAMNKYSK